MNKSSKERFQEALARLQEIVQSINLRNELKAERQQEKDRERKLEHRLKK